MEITSQLDGAEIATTKQKVRNAVSAYQKQYPQEYSDVISLVARKRKDLHNQYGAALGDHAFERILYEIPETLNNIFVFNLTDDQLLWMKTKTGARWFTRTFKQFALAEV